MSERKRRLWDVVKPAEVELYALVGMALGHVQSVEDILPLVMTFVFQKGDKLDIYMIEAQTKAEQKKTLGYFIGELRKRVGIRADLEDKLLSFLERRNTLAHRLAEVPGWEAGPVAGFDETAIFLSTLIEDSHELLVIFATLVQAWQKEAMPFATLPHEDLIEKLTERYRLELYELFFEKE